jgi:hypothetical protein
MSKVLMTGYRNIEHRCLVWNSVFPESPARDSGRYVTTAVSLSGDTAETGIQKGTVLNFTEKTRIIIPLS